MNSTKSASQNLCPCESGKQYNACCEPYHLGLVAPTAEALMRSRYTAFVLILEEYLLKTWHPHTCPSALDLDENHPTKWLGLQIKRIDNTSESTATVEFIAHYKIAGKAARLHEISQFIHMKGCWYYLVGDHLTR